jgi:hypothetical protein
VNGDKVKFKGGGKEEEIENYITRKHCFLDEELTLNARNVHAFTLVVSILSEFTIGFFIVNVFTFVFFI